jgi:hypothetical protein
MEKQIVKPFATENSERLVYVKPKPQIKQLGNSFRSWLRGLEELDPKPKTRRIIVSSKVGRDVNKLVLGEGSTITILEDDIVEREPKASLLRRLLKQEKSNYKTLFIPKRNSDEKREVKAPIHSLKRLQVMLLRYLYENTKVADSAHGFEPKRGNWTAAASIAAAMKTKQRFSVLTQDLKAAFGSVTEKQVREVLKKSGLTGFPLHAATRVATYEGILATGSPCSPRILNLLFKRVDEKMEQWAKQKGGVYIRYADDISIALPTWRMREMREARELLRRQFRKLGIELHPLKTKITRLGLDSDSAEVIGIATQQQKCTRPRRLRNKLRGLIRSIRKSLAQGKQEDAESRLLVVEGLIAYFSGEFKAIREAKKANTRKLRFAKT